jgi:hypothetical protein
MASSVRAAVKILMDIQRVIIRTVRSTGGGTDGADATAVPVRDYWEWALVDVGIVLLFVVVPHWVASGYDGAVRFQALTELLERRPVAPTLYSFVGPLFSAPLYYLGRLAFDSAWWCSFYNTVLLTGGLIAVVWLLRRHTDKRVLRMFCLLIVAGSMFPNHVRDYFGEMFTAMFVCVGIAALSVGRDALGWTAMVMGVVNTPATLIGMLFVAVRHVRQTRRLRHLTAVVAAALLIMLEQWIRRGNPFVSGYESITFARTVMPYSGGPGFNYPIFFGVLSILFSFGKGLVFFAPGLLLPIRGDEAAVSRAPREVWAYSLWFVAGLIVVYAKWWSWYGGWAWGPRFFLLASVPASLAIAVKLQRTKGLKTPVLVMLIAIVTLSVWVAINGAVFDKSDLRACTDNLWALEFLCWYTPEFSVLWHPFIVRSPIPFDQALFIGYCTIVWMYLIAPLLWELSGRLWSAFGILARDELKELRF